MMLIGSHGEEDFVSDFAVDIGVSSAFRTMRGVRSFSVFMLYFSMSFPMDETSVGTTCR